MYLVQIDVVGPQAAEASFHAADYVLGRGAYVVGSVAYPEAGLGGDDEVIASVFEGSAQYVFRLPP